jgi:hypothetical protein
LFFADKISSRMNLQHKKTELKNLLSFLGKNKGAIFSEINGRPLIVFQQTKKESRIEFSYQKKLCQA